MSGSRSRLIPFSKPDSGLVNWSDALVSHRVELNNLVRKRLSGAGEGAVDDILQEVALTAHSEAGETVSPGSEQAWLRQVAINKVKDYWRRIERRGALEHKYSTDGGASGSISKSPYEWVMALETTEVINTALDQMSADEREALIRKYLEGQTCREIAQSDGVPEKTIEYRLKKARQTMRAILTKFI